jgi:NAD(P)-dependent dehydrogenase (short-subunit alcohol dehydrogenase family)
MQVKAIVTGHTKGLGAAIAGELLGRGIPVLGVARRSCPGLAARFQGLLTEVQLDLGDSAELNNWLAGPRLDAHLQDATVALLVNNAGVVTPIGPLHEQEPHVVAKAVALNVAAPLALAAAVVRASAGRERRIVHISSGAGRNAYPGWSVYCATKAALDMHARAVALDGDPQVRAVSLAPGVIDTDMQAEIRATPQDNFPMRQRFVDLKADGELAAPGDAARAIVDYALGTRFGAEPVADLRQLGR